MLWTLIASVSEIKEISLGRVRSTLTLFCLTAVAFAGSCTLDLQRAGGVLGIVGGGEGFFNTVLTGPGT